MAIIMASTPVRYPTPNASNGSPQHTSVGVTDPLLWQGQRQVKAKGRTPTPRPRGLDFFLIKRMLRWRGDESLEIYARVNDADWADWTQKMVNVAVDSTIASRLTYMDFSVETRQRFTDIAEAMLSLNAGTARAATGAL